MGRFLLGGQGRRDFEGVKRHPSVALGVLGQKCQSFLIGGEVLSTKAAFLVLQSTSQQKQQIVRTKGFEDDHSRTRQQRGDDFKRGVLCRRAEKHDQALFHVR